MSCYTSSLLYLFANQIKQLQLSSSWQASSAKMTILREHNRSRSLETLRTDFLHFITNTAVGVHFASDNLLEDKVAEKEVLAALCPEKAYKGIDIAIAHLSKLFVQCNKWLPVYDKRGPDAYWIVAASTTSEMQGIALSATQAKSVVFALLRARQRWILRQTNPTTAKTDVNSHFIAGVQRLLQRFEEKDESSDAAIWQRERGWKLTEREIRDANSRLMGPGRQMARGRIGLSYHSPHNLYPIGQLSSAPKLERNLLGLLDSSVEKVTPAEAVQALLSDRAQEAVFAAQTTTPGRGTPGDGRSSKSPGSFVSRMIPSALKTKFKPNWMLGSGSRKDISQSLVERPKRAQTADPPSKVNPSSTKRRFMSEDASAVPAKKQVFAKGKARSVSNPVVSQPSLAPSKTRVARSASLQAPKTVQQ
ncbi:hypothetical protein V8C35DRAFT_306049 [Trichoderma chlorosporum]